MKILFFIIPLIILSCSAGLRMKSSSEHLHLNPTEKLLIMERDSLSPMKIIENDTDYENDFLRQKALPISSDDKTSIRLAQRMKATLDSVPGVGIAAPQVGISRKVIIVQRLDKEAEPFETYFNPEIIQYSKEKETGWEGCLSIPEGFGKVERSKEITIQYETSQGIRKEEIKGFTAVIFQHEIDHLKGILFIDKLIPNFGRLVPEEEYRKTKKNQNRQ